MTLIELEALRRRPDEGIILDGPASPRPPGALFTKLYPCHIGGIFREGSLKRSYKFTRSRSIAVRNVHNECQSIPGTIRPVLGQSIARALPDTSRI